jgi:thiol-disulfide isomerase/thioredoxin
MSRRLLSLAIVALLTLAASGREGPDRPASLSLKDLHGAKARLSDLRGKIVVLNFWATWCEPCNAEMPMVLAAAKAYEGKGVVFVGASVDLPETQRKVPQFVSRMRLDYPIWIGATDDDMKRLELGNEVPGTAFLDADGVVRARILGQMRPGEMEERLDWLLRGRQGAAPAAVVKHL